MATDNIPAPPVGGVILQDLHAAVAGALELLRAERLKASQPTHAETLLACALDRAQTLREVLHG